MSRENFEILNNKIAGYLLVNLSLKGRIKEMEGEIGKFKKDLSSQKSKAKKLTEENKVLKLEIESLMGQKKKKE